jgi:hypothetical protein
MQAGELYVNDILIDLPNNYLIALSYAVNTFTDLKSVQGNISNSIDLPNTARNRAALGFPDDMNFNGQSLIRRKQPCRYVQNGVDVIPQGNLRIIGAAKGVLKIVISSGNTDFFDLLTGKLRDLDFSEYDHIWNQTNVVNSRLNTNGYLYPIINYGNLANNDGTIYSSVTNPRQMRPAIYAKTTVKKIVESVGYTLIDEIASDLVTNELYDKLLLPFSDDKFVHSQRFIDAKIAQNLVAQETASRVYDDPGGSGTDYWLGLGTVVSGNGSAWDGSHFTANEIMTVDVDFAFDKIWSETFTGSHKDGGDYQLHAIQNGVDNVIARAQTRIGESDFVTGGGFGHFRTEFLDYHISAQGVVLQPGDKIYMNIGALYGCFQTVFPNVTLKITRVNDAVVFGEEVQVESVLPDMTYSDFLKYISFLFCATIQADSLAKTVKIVPFSYIIQQMPYAKDWSNKVTNDSEDIDVEIGNYCQQNEAKYSADDNVSPTTYGNGTMYITDENLDIYQDIYDIPFAASYESLVLGNLRTLQINKIPDRLLDTMSINTVQRICLLNRVNTSINYQSYGTDPFQNITSSVPLTYFKALDGSTDLMMDTIFKNNYKDLINVLNDQRKITCYLQLNEIDIQDLDFFTPVFIQKYSCYFYISKITDFTGLKPCRVELIKLL